MKNSTTFATLATITIVFACIMGTIYVLGLKKKPLKHKSIPETVISWVKQIDSTKTDMGFINLGDGPYEWDNGEDYGSDPANGYTSLNYDPNFIVYYRDDPAGIWKQNAEALLNEANMAMGDLASFMGSFPAPTSFYGRRLPIYLPSSELDYVNTATAICGHPAGSGTAGLYVHGYGLHGPIAKALLINPRTFPDLEDSYWYYKNSYHFVLRHEMNHYVFFSNLDYTAGESHRTWEYEGLADFFAYELGEKTEFVAGQDSIDFIKNRCLLTGEFPNDDMAFVNSEYWAGESLYKFLKETAGEQNTSRFVRYLYMEPFEEAVTHMLPDTLDVHAAWVESLVEKAI